MKVIIYAAGSGGHIYPALSLAQQLKQIDPGAKIVFLSTKKDIERKIFEAAAADSVLVTDFISPHEANRGNLFSLCLKNLDFLLKFTKEALRVLYTLCRMKPDAVVGFGGIGSIAAVAGARMLNIPALIHEPNAVPGRANRLLAHFASKVTTGYRQSHVHFKRKDIECTGNPLRGGLKKIDKTIARESFGLRNDKFTVLVFGGSQGAQFVNWCFVEAMKALPKPKISHIQVIHLAGETDAAAVETAYQGLEITAKTFSYLADIGRAYSAADLVICRSGAGTLNEISFFGKTAVLIPYPLAASHQKANARLMQETAAMHVIEQDKNCAARLRQLLTYFMDNPAVLHEEAMQNTTQYHENAAALLAEQVQRLVKVRQARAS